MTLSLTPVIDGAAKGTVLRLAAPISFWGGVDPATGKLTSPRHPNHGAAISGTVLVLPGTIGSSSSSAIMLELLRVGLGPAALILAEVDAILALGVVVAREMGYPIIPVLHGPVDSFATGQQVRVIPGGSVEIATG